MHDDANEAHGFDLRRTGLRVFLGLLVVNALLGIAVMLGGDLGDGGGRVLATSLVVTGGVMLGLGSAASRPGSRLGPIWMIGVAAAALATVLWIIGIWTDSDSDGLFKTAGSASVLGAGVACVSLLGLAQIRGRARWTLMAADLLIAGLVAMSIVAIWSEGAGGSFWRLFGVLSIALAALAIAIPVLHRAEQRSAPPASGTSTQIRFCPSCGASIAAAGDEAHCGRCQAHFTVRFDST